MLDIEAVADWSEFCELLAAIFPHLDIPWDGVAGPTLDVFDIPHWLPFQCCHVVLLYCEYDDEIQLLDPGDPCYLPRDFTEDPVATSLGHNLITFCPDVCRDFADETVEACTLLA